MATTMKKSEIQVETRRFAHDIMNLNQIEGLVQIGADEYVFPAYTTPDGDTVYYGFKGAVKNWRATEKVPAFDPNVAAEDFRADQEFKAQQAAAKAEAKARKAASKSKSK